MSLPAAADGGTPSARLAGVDGLRALAALWVVLFHVRAFSGARLTAVPGLDFLVRSGSTGVSLFLILSGFCLYLPFAGGRWERFGTRRFLVRRGRRLLPAYYVSLGLIVLATVVAGGHLGLQAFSGPALTGQVAAHATFVHQLLPSTFYALNGSYWSLGLEWELYLTLPLLILAGRRFGLARTVAGVFVVNLVYVGALALATGQHLIAPGGSLATVVLPNLIPGRWAEFALGMVAAELAATGRVQKWGRRLAPVLLVSIPLGILAAGDPIGHMIFGSVFFVLLCLVLARDGIVSRVMSWPPLVLIGLMSYSLYLVHQPLVQIGASLLGAGHTSPTRVFVELLLMIPLVLFGAWLLFVTVERRSLTSHAVEDVPGRWIFFPSWAPFRTAGRRLAAVRLRPLWRHERGEKEMIPSGGESV